MNESPTFVNFNPTNDERVAEIKAATDDLISMVANHAAKTEDGQRRAILAMDAYELAAMWAVKSCFS